MVVPAVTLLWRTDLHLADEGPQSRLDDWPTTLLGKLQEIGEIARHVNAAGVIDGGDFFHVKTPGRNSHELIRRAAEVHASYPCSVYGNVGNHDVKYGSLEFLNESPLGVLLAAGVIKRLYDNHEALFVKDGVKVRVVGIPYHGTKYDMNRLTTLVRKDEDKLVVVAHMLASPSGGTLFDAEDVLKYRDLANLDVDVWCFGHWHRNQGVTEIAPGKWVVNIGSLSRGALTQDEMSRVPAVAVMDFWKDRVAIRQVPLQVRPAKEVFNVEGRARLEARAASVDALVDNLKVTLQDRSVTSLTEEVLARGDVPPNVKERTLLYLERAAP